MDHRSTHVDDRDLRSLDRVRIYDRLAPRYDRLHAKWLRYAGGEAQAALEAVVRARCAPGMRLLDVGSGTGAFVRRLVAEDMGFAEVTMLEPSAEMLERCPDVGVRKVHGRGEAMPFPDDAFDLVTCAWAIEVVHDPILALRELCRVVAPGGAICIIFCADKPPRSIMDLVMRAAIHLQGTGAFLSTEMIVDGIRDRRGYEVSVIPTRGPATALLIKRGLGKDGAD